MAGEHDSWLKSAFELDVSKILTSTPGDGAAAPEFSSGATANSMASGFQKQAEGALEVLGSARRALGDLEQAKLDVAKGVVIKGISGVAGATAGLASAAGDEDFADELRAAQANADAERLVRRDALLHLRQILLQRVPQLRPIVGGMHERRVREMAEAVT